MSDLQLVIKIPEELKNKIDNANDDNYRTYQWWFETTLYCAIKDGTPLPKEHGRLIDADVLVDGMEDDYEFCEVVNATPTIIEADKESEDK